LFTISEIEPNQETKFDIIISSETIYNEKYYEKLHFALKEAAKEKSIIYLAAKSHYFGCGGSVFGWIQFVKKINYFKFEIIWTSDTELKRNIIKMWLE
jgi:hypothetical protein